MKQSFINNLTSKLARADKKQLALNNLLTILVLAFVIITIGVNPKFLSISVAFEIVNRMGRTLLMALGMAGIMIVGGTDLSAGRLSGLCGVITASMLQNSGLVNEVLVGHGNIPVIVPLIICLVIGALVGLINAFVIIKFKVHAFIMTLAMSMVIYSIIYKYMSLGTNGNRPISVDINSDIWKFITGGIIIAGQKIEYVAMFVAVITVVVWVIWNKTSIGRSMYAVGGNRDAAAVTGISILKTTLIVFAIAGALYGLTGLVNGIRSTQNVDSGNGLDLNAIAACIIGGVSFAGGIGKIRGVIFGVFLMTLLNLALVFLEINNAYIQLVSGLIIILAVAIDMRKVSKGK